MTPRRLAAALLLSTTALATATAAQAGTSTTVDVQDYMFMPPELTVAIGHTVTWTFSDPVMHTSTSTQGFWDSGDKGQGSTYSHAFNSAGTYPYLCTIHAYMAGKVTVPLNATGSPAAGYRVVWADAASPSGTTYDIQQRKPGSTRWVTLRAHTTSASTGFDPAKPGTYQVRARTVHGTSTSDWSPARKLRIS